MRVAIYLRRSTTRQEASLADQQRELIALAERQKYEVVANYQDDGISGDDSARRLGFQRMVADGVAGRFTRILVWDLDRFSRNDPIEAATWILPLRDAGISLETIAQGVVDWNSFAGRLSWSVLQEGKHQYLRDLSRNCARGVRAAVVAGSYPAVAPFGYVKVGKRLALGQQKHVDAVRRIFALRLQGFGQRAIAQKMAAEGWEKPGAPWGSSFIEQVLAREAYTGSTVCGKRRTGKYHHVFDGPQRFEATHPPIIDRDTWLRTRGTPDRQPAVRRGQVVSPFSGLVVCGKCGGNMNAITHHGVKGYACERYRTGKGCVFCFVAEDALLEGLQKCLAHCVTESKFRAELELLGRSREKSPDPSQQVDELTRRIERASERLLLIDDSLVSKMQQKISAMVLERDRLLRQTPDLPETPHPEDVKEILANTLQALRNPAHREASRKLIQAALLTPIEIGVTLVRQSRKLAVHRMDSCRISLISTVPLCIALGSLVPYVPRGVRRQQTCKSGTPTS